MKPQRNAIIIGLAAAVLLAIVAWVVGRGIRSPAQVAADTAPPGASLITVPVERQMLSTEVIVRGTVRYGSPRAVVLASSTLKPNSSIVSRPPRLGGNLREGSLAMAVSGRPVFVLRGTQPMSRDLGPGSVGPDVRQLEQALSRLGFRPGAVDDRFDTRTEKAVVAWYAKAGWTPFGATDAQLEQLRVARTAAGAAHDAVLQARLAVETAARNATPAEVSQARLDAATAADAIDAAALTLSTARSKVEAARDTAARLTALAAGPSIAARVQADIAAADADVASKQAALDTAIDTQTETQRRLDQAPPDLPPADLEALRTAQRQAAAAVPVARQGVEAAKAAAGAARAAAPASTDQAQADARGANRDARLAEAEQVRALRALTTSKRQAALAQERVIALTSRADTRLQRQIVSAAQSMARRADADVARLAGKVGVQVPADEVVFFPTLPLRVDAAGPRRGDIASGRVMTVTSSQLAADSSLTINDAKLVRVGAPVTIEEQDLAIKVRGTVTQVAGKPGTNKVDPTRVYFEVTPKQAPVRLVGASVKLTIAVKTTKGKVLAVPLSALSVGAGGGSRLQVHRGGSKTEYVAVVPGLVANGLVEVRSEAPGKLRAGDLVVVGLGGVVAPSASGVSGGAGGPGPVQGGTTTGTGSGGAGAGTGTPPGVGTSPGTGTETVPGGGPAQGTSTSTVPGAGTTTGTAPAGGATTGTGGGGSTP